VPGLVEALTARELEVLGLLAAGKSSRHIATELVVSLDTVKKHVSHVLDELRADNRTEAVARPESWASSLDAVAVAQRHQQTNALAPATSTTCSSPRGDLRCRPTRPAGWTARP
jgi:DNA-binding CsgD family transcriptional regulator